MPGSVPVWCNNDGGAAVLRAALHCGGNDGGGGGIAELLGHAGVAFRSRRG
jgi:hypothetical protein